jgi:predicted amidohydrolase
MANCVGPCDDFEAVGGSGAWNARGELLARLPSSSEGALLLDTETDETLAIA